MAVTVSVVQARTCSVPGCACPHSARDLCSAHYARLRRNGSPTGGGSPRPRRPIKICEIDGCGKQTYARGLCRSHRRQQIVHGDPVKTLKPGKGDGYVRRVVSGKLKRVHTIVMEEIIGRPLLRSESVHHKNGQRDDNRPENLELWSRSQPAGQRVEDKVAWALEILRLYKPETLK